ncbi:MAG: CHAT domain-containing protein [Gemmatimonadaceae bacterium]|nr:CHAT domain-containing protein [Gemmatimonadaceae bacterium]
MTRSRMLTETAMIMMCPVVLDAEQPASDVHEILGADGAPSRQDVVVVRQRDGLGVSWWIARIDVLIEACAIAKADETIGAAMLVAPLHLGLRAQWDRALVRDVREMPRVERVGRGWLALFAGQRMVGVSPPVLLSGPPDAPASAPAFGAPDASAPHDPAGAPTPVPTGSSAIENGGGRTNGETSRRGPTRGHRARPPQPESAGAPPPDDDAALGLDEPATAGTSAEVDTLLALPRVALPDRCLPGADSSVTLTIGLQAPIALTDMGIMTFVSARTVKTIEIDVMVEAPDFTAAAGFRHTLTVEKSDPFSKSLEVKLVPAAPDDERVRQATVRVHYSYHGQPAGTAVRRIALGNATAADAQAMPQPPATPLQLAPSATPVDLTIRIARRDESEAARDLIWTLMDCPHPIELPNAPIVRKVGERDTASSFASRVTSTMNDTDGKVTLDGTLRGVGTFIRQSMPPEVVQALRDVAAAVGTARLARILLLTDECYVPWELAFLDPAPNTTRAPYLGAQFAVSRWLHGEAEVPVPPPATLAVSNLAIVLGNYDATSLAALPHAKEESDALLAASTGAPTRYPHVTSVNATPDAVVDLLNGALPSPSGPIAPELVHFACHGEVLGTGMSKRSVLYMSDGQPLSEFLFVASTLGKSKKSFLFMNACQVGNGGTELNRYAGFPGMAIGAGFSGFVGPLWSVNDQIAKGIALDFYARAFGADGNAPRAVSEVLADMRSQYASEPDPKKRQSTWLAYVHYGHPHFSFTHA